MFLLLLLLFVSWCWTFDERMSMVCVLAPLHICLYICLFTWMYFECACLRMYFIYVCLFAYVSACVCICLYVFETACKSLMCAHLDVCLRVCVCAISCVSNCLWVYLLECILCMCVRLTTCIYAYLIVCVLVCVCIWLCVFLFVCILSIKNFRFNK